MNKYIQPVQKFLEENDWASEEPEFICLQYDVVDEMKANKVGFEIFQDVLELMEVHPLVEFGTPGALTHFVEKFYRENQEQYEKLLKKSVEEKPAIHTIWLLHRVINGNQGEKAEELIQIIKSIYENEKLHKEIRTVAGNFLKYHREKTN